MIVPFLLCGVVLLPTLWVIVRGQDAWPFSHYPMFSHLINPSEVAVFRIALESANGEVTWWRSEFYRYPEFVGRKLKLIQQRESEGGRTAALASLEKQRWLAEVLRLIEAEGGLLERYEAVQIVRRTAGTADGIDIRDETVARFPLALIKRISRD